MQYYCIALVLCQMWAALHVTEAQQDHCISYWRTDMCCKNLDQKYSIGDTEDCYIKCSEPPMLCNDILKERILRLSHADRVISDEERVNFEVSLLALDSLNYAGMLHLTLEININWQSNESRWDSCPEHLDSSFSSCHLFVNRTEKVDRFYAQPSETKSYDFKLFNDASFSMLSKKMQGVPLEIYRDGFVGWFGIIPVAIKCNLDVTRFPFDRQSCDVAWEIVPWRHVVHDCRKEGNIDNADWSVLSFNQSEDWPVCQVVLERRSMKWIVTLVLPFGAFNILVSLVYFLPPSSGERVGYSVTLVLSFSVILMAIGDLLPNSANLFPLRE